MADVWSKLNLKDQAEIVVVNAPSSFESEIAALDGVTVRRKAAGAKRIAFFLGFVTTHKELDALAKVLGKKTDGDAVVWVAYPKSTSRTYTSEIARDTGNDALGEAGFEPVRMIAIDEDWSAKRFRRAEFIQTMTRPRAVRFSKAGRNRK